MEGGDELDSESRRNAEASISEFNRAGAGAGVLSFERKQNRAVVLSLGRTAESPADLVLKFQCRDSTAKIHIELTWGWV